MFLFNIFMNVIQCQHNSWLYFLIHILFGSPSELQYQFLHIQIHTPTPLDRNVIPMKQLLSQASITRCHITTVFNHGWEYCDWLCHRGCFQKMIQPIRSSFIQWQNLYLALRVCVHNYRGITKSKYIVVFQPPFPVNSRCIILRGSQQSRVAGQVFAER